MWFKLPSHWPLGCAGKRKPKRKPVREEAKRAEPKESRAMWSQCVRIVVVYLLAGEAAQHVRKHSNRHEMISHHGA